MYGITYVYDHLSWIVSNPEAIIRWTPYLTRTVVYSRSFISSGPYVTNVLVF